MLSALLCWLFMWASLSSSSSTTARGAFFPWLVRAIRNSWYYEEIEIILENVLKSCTW